MYGGIIHEKGVENTKEWVGIRRRDFSLQFNGIEKHGVYWQFLLELQNNKMPYEFTKYKGGDLDLKFYSTSNNFPLIFSR